MRLDEIIEYFPQYDIMKWSEHEQENFCRAFEAIWEETIAHGRIISKPVSSRLIDEEGVARLNLDDPFNRSEVDRSFGKLKGNHLIK